MPTERFKLPLDFACSLVESAHLEGRAVKRACKLSACVVGMRCKAWFL